MAARKSAISIDYGVFEDLAAELETLGADLQKIMTDVMEQEGETVAEDTKEAVQHAYLPAKGAYSTGETEKSIVSKPTVKWSGPVGEMGLGFDKSKPGAGGFLITGTPRMAPDHQLEKIYSQKSYERKMTKDIAEYLEAEIQDRLKRFT